MNRIWVRLFLAFVVVLVVSVGTITLYTSYMTSQEFIRYVNVARESRESRFARALASQYGEHNGWTGAQTTVAFLAQLSDERIILIDPDDNVVADSTGQLVGRTILTPTSETWVEVANGNRIVGRFFVGPPGNPIRFTPRDSAFLQSMNRSAVLAVGIGGVLAVIFCLLLSRRIVKPIEALTRAARRLEGGDLTQRVETGRHDEFGQLASAFNSMAASLERSHRGRQQMVSDIAHELRTPLSNLRGYIEGLRDGVVAADEATVEVLYGEAMLLSRLVDDLQELSLAEAGQLSLDLAPAAPAELIRATVAATRTRAVDLGIDLVAEASDELPPVLADSRRTRQILHNLLNNALGHTPPGGSVTIRAQAKAGQMEFTVADTGFGIRPADLPYIFDRFYRSDPSRARATGGVGIGLTITKQLVLAQGGAIEVESELGTGTMFRFTLPLAPADAFQALSQPAKAIAHAD